MYNSWQDSDSWNENISKTTQNLIIWNKDIFGNIFKKKHRLLRRLEGINRVLLSNHSDRLIALREQLWQEYSSIVKYEEVYWYQQARSKRIMLWDLNTIFFHNSAFQRKRNKISALQNDNDEWIYDD